MVRLDADLNERLAAWLPDRTVLVR